ncbi:MAG: 5'/3'-nucleotidase SurE [Asgard group archaeon]|nr:5'/3'-nucleotidase SurE [Asgard group archaeon]
MTSVKPKILLTNDDGIRSNGLIQLYHELAKFADVTIITPHVQRSGESKAITINQIIRVETVDVTNSKKGYIINGTAADCVIFGLHALEERPFDLVVSGINQGLNISSHIILTSGTCAAALEASFYDVPAIALSMNVMQSHYFVSPSKETFTNVAKSAAKIVKKLIRKSFPKGLAFINVNFPFETTEETPIEIATIFNKFLDFKPELRKDPRNNDYYFFWGEPTFNAPKGSDVEVIGRGCISLSPASNDLNTTKESNLISFLLHLIKKENK